MYAEYFGLHDYITSTLGNLNKMENTFIKPLKSDTPGFFLYFFTQQCSLCIIVNYENKALKLCTLRNIYVENNVIIRLSRRTARSQNLFTNACNISRPKLLRSLKPTSFVTITEFIKCLQFRGGKTISDKFLSRSMSVDNILTSVQYWEYFVDRF